MYNNSSTKNATTSIFVYFSFFDEHVWALYVCRVRVCTRNSFTIILLKLKSSNAILTTCWDPLIWHDRTLLWGIVVPMCRSCLRCLFNQNSKPRYSSREWWCRVKIVSCLTIQEKNPLFKDFHWIDLYNPIMVVSYCACNSDEHPAQF